MGRWTLIGFVGLAVLAAGCGAPALSIRASQDDAYYAQALREQTTTELTPQQVYETGLAEVARITAEMDAILVAQGMSGGTVGARMKALGEDGRYHFENSDAGRQAILDMYGGLIAEARMRLPEAFATIPPQGPDVVRMPKSAEAGSGRAYYSAPAVDGTRPGRLYVNLRDVADTPKWAMKTLAYHEGIPGHHLQISTAQKRGLPSTPSPQSTIAYTEGWALYAERLAWEMGLYEGDPLGDLGRLQNELFRAAGLVVDTGLHDRSWSRAQAIAHLVDTIGMAADAAAAEVGRYAVMPGQACAYTIGMLKILELRERAKTALGARFDIRAFHAVVLDSGPLPLSELEQLVDRWIARQKGA